jgi:hypothetical protein
MKIRHLALAPMFSLAIACGGSNPEPETPAGEAAGAMEEAAPAEEAPMEEPMGGAEEAAPAEGEAAPAEGGEATPAE